MKGKWRVSSNPIGGETYYIVFRIRDTSKVDHSGNREYAHEYTENRLEAEALRDELNRQEGGHK